MTITNVQEKVIRGLLRESSSLNKRDSALDQPVFVLTFHEICKLRVASERLSVRLVPVNGEPTFRKPKDEDVEKAREALNDVLRGCRNWGLAL